MRSSIRFRSIGDEAVVLCQASAEILVLNGVGCRLLQLLDGVRTDERLATMISQEYEVDGETASHHVREFLEELEQAGVVQAVDSGSSEP